MLSPCDQICFPTTPELSIQSQYFYQKTTMKFLIHDWFSTPLVLALFSSLFAAVPSVQCRDEEKLCIKVNKRKLSNKIRHNYRLLWGTFYFYFRPIPQSHQKQKIFSSLSPNVPSPNVFSTKTPRSHFKYNFNKIKRISKLVLSFCKFNLDLQGLSRIENWELRYSIN